MSQGQVVLNPETCGQLLTAEALARALSVKLSWIRDFSGPGVPADKRIPSILIGSRLRRYKLEDVSKWIESQQAKWDAVVEKTVEKRLSSISPDNKR